MLKKMLFLILTLSLFSGFCFIPAEGQSKQKRKTIKISKKSIKTQNETAEYEKKLLAEIDEELEKNKPSKIYVFVGERIEIEPLEQKLKEGEISMDSAFTAKYRVIQNVYGNYNKDTIEFQVYDHYGVPPFSKYENVLLFVSEYDGKLYHEKYQYFDVYQTKDGKWASCGDPYRFDEYHRKNIKAVNLEFAEPLIFDLDEYKKDYRPDFVKEFFKKPFFKVTANSAQCLMGVFADDLFTVKKEGVLKARRIF